MPWLPELFSYPALTRIWDDERRKRLALVPFFVGLMTGEIDALVESFAGEPELHHPVRGRIKGVAAFERYAAETNAWLADRGATPEDVDFVIARGRGVEELILHLDGDDGRIELPVAIASDHDEKGLITEQRMYFSSWPLTGGHAIRPPLLQPDPGLREPGVIADYQHALAAGDAEAAVAAFEPAGYVREPAGGAHTHRGTDELRALYERFFSNGGGIQLERCAVTDDGRACALEYNLVAWGRTMTPPQAGLAVYVRGDSGKLAAARIYDDADPPLARATTSDPTGATLAVTSDAARNSTDGGTMSSTQMSADTATAGSGAAPVPLRLEAVVLPVTDVDRAKAFYERLGWRLDADFPIDEHFRVVQFTPPGSPASIQFGTGTSTMAGPVEDMYLIVDDIAAAREDLISRGADVTEVWHGRGLGPEGHEAGPDPEHTSYRSFASFTDPDGNRYLLQEITERLPGRTGED